MKFNINGPLFQFLGTLTDFIFLNLIFLVTCIPVITIGPAISALFSITMREARGEHGYIVRPYLKAFKDNFGSSLILFLIYFAAGAVLFFNFGFWLNLNSILGNVILVILAFCAVSYVLSLIYVFALNARFQNTIRQTMKNSLLLALSSPKQTGILLVILLLTVLFLYLFQAFRIFLVIFGFGFLAYCASFPFTKVFEAYE